MHGYRGVIDKGVWEFQYFELLWRSELRAEEGQQVLLEELRVNIVLECQVEGFLYLRHKVHPDFLA